MEPKHGKIMKYKEIVVESTNSNKSQQFIDQVYSQYPDWPYGQADRVMVWGTGEDQQFAAFKLKPGAGADTVEIDWIMAGPEQRQGVGSRAIQELQRLARSAGIRLTLYPWSHGQISQAALTRFYKRNGFKPMAKGAKPMSWSPIDEAFDQPYRLVWEKGDFGDLSAYTTLPDGTTLDIMFNQEGEDHYTIEFWRNYTQDTSYEGDSQRIFATVLWAIQKFLRKKQPKYISFTAERIDRNQDSRVSLYTKLLQRYANSWGYAVRNVFDKGPAVTFDLVKIKPDDSSQQSVPLDEVVIDNNAGAGAVPNNSNVDYMGLRVAMRPSTFLQLAAPLSTELDPGLVKYIANGGAIGAPFLQINIPEAWDTGDFSEPAQVTGHEGRNRMHAIKKLEGDDPVEVHIFPRYYRARHMTPEFVKNLNSHLQVEQSQRIKAGPLFTLLAQPGLAENLGESLIDLLADLESSPWTMVENTGSVQFLRSKIFDETLEKKARQAPNASDKVQEFIQYKTQNPLQAWGSKDKPFPGDGPIGRAFPKLRYAHLTSDIILFYSMEGRDPILFKLYGVFSHDDIGIGMPRNVNKQKSFVKRLAGQNDMTENFEDGRGPGRPGDSVRHGIPKHATRAELEQASHSAGRKGQLARWQLNMRRGHKK